MNLKCILNTHRYDRKKQAKTGKPVWSKIKVRPPVFFLGIRNLVYLNSSQWDRWSLNSTVQEFCTIIPRGGIEPQLYPNLKPSYTPDFNSRDQNCRSVEPVSIEQKHKTKVYIRNSIFFLSQGSRFCSPTSKKIWLKSKSHGGKKYWGQVQKNKCWTVCYC